ncbi:MAG: hypothetical protein JXB06_03170 [Spirochaetales bacterium]|nr:hypothetical protein [Spirochaetales bacterium]
MRKHSSRFLLLLKRSSAHVLLAAVGAAMVLAVTSCGDGGTPIYQYVSKTTAADEDYVDFGSMEGFTAPGAVPGDWSVIEKVKLPTDYATGGWHVFRGKGWEDKVGDLAIQLSPTRVHAWFYRGSWANVIHDTTVQLGRWYTICFQHDSGAQTLELYLDGVLVGSLDAVIPQDDSGNTNKLFFGGQDVDPGEAEGDLYSEADIVIAHQAWFQRLLTAPEIAAYDGTLDAVDGTGLFFETAIGETGITDASGNGHDGTNGNTPEFYLDAM